MILTVTSVLLGVATGTLMRQMPLTWAQITYLAFLGEMLFCMLKTIILPLLICSLVSRTASLDTWSLGKLGSIAIACFLVTTLIASVLTDALPFIIKPGVNAWKLNSKDLGLDGTMPTNKETVESFLDLAQ